MRQTNFRKTYWKAAAFVALLAAWVSVPLLNNIVKADGTAVILVRTATLANPSGSPNPHGAATYQVYQSGNKELEVEGEDFSQPAGTVLTFFIDGTNIGTASIDSNAKAKLKLKTESGQSVPNVNNGSVAEVRNGSTVLLRGTFTSAATGTPTATPTGSPSATPTGSPSVTPTGSPSGSPTGTATPSPTPTETPEQENEIYAILSGATINGTLPRGFASYEIHSNRTELEVRVSQINLPSGTVLSVVVNGTAAGNITLLSGGEGRLRLRSDQGNTVPVITAGSTIAIKNGAATILTGTFANSGGPTPTPTGTPLGRFFEGMMTVPGSTNTYYAPHGEFRVQLDSSESQATITGEYARLQSAQTSTKITVTVGSVTTVIYDYGTLGGTQRVLAPVTIPVTPQQVQQLRMSLWQGTVGTVTHPTVEIQGLIRPDTSNSDFDGDGGDDFAVFRPSTGTFFVAAGNNYSTQVLGNASDKVVSGDYDGDGKTDAAVFHSVGGQGVWYVQRSSDAGVTITQYGLASDTTVRGDFDGDGRTDLGVFRASTGVWYILKSNGTGQIITQFGLNGDVPVAADFDGDGKDDIAVFRPSNGLWYWTNSSDGSLGVVQFGLSGDIPVAGDFDGDGQADVSVFRPSTGVWYIQHSSDQSFDIRQFGLNGDVPVAGRYDSDTKTDIAVFRPSDGNWYIMRSMDGRVQINHFGLSGDIPLIAK